MSLIKKINILCFFSIVFSHDERKDYDKFRSVLDLVGKLLEHDSKIASLTTQLEDARAFIADLNETKLQQSKDERHDLFSPAAASSYIRWGRRSCPDNATLVYEGFAAGSRYTETGGAANYLCLPQNPDWDDHDENPDNLGLIYGGEYETRGSYLNELSEHDVPCAICRVPRNVLMVPGKNICLKHYRLEYNGYLMSGYPTHQAASEYVCVDKDPEPAAKSNVADHNGKLFYFVQAKCGSLKCPPYNGGFEITCAVCSYSP